MNIPEAINRMSFRVKLALKYTGDETVKMRGQILQLPSLSKQLPAVVMDKKSNFDDTNTSVKRTTRKQQRRLRRNNFNSAHQ